MSTLHIVNSSASASNALQRALEFASAGDAILLIENAVYAAVDNPESSRLLDQSRQGCTENPRLFALQEDCHARALYTLAPEFKTVDYAGFVALVCEHDNSISWS